MWSRFDAMSASTGNWQPATSNDVFMNFPFDFVAVLKASWGGVIILSYEGIVSEGREE